MATSGKMRMPNNFEVDRDNFFTLKLNDAVDVAREKVLGRKEVSKTKRIYFAGPWFDYRSNLLYDCCKSVVEICNKSSKYSVYFPRDEENKSPSDAFSKNVKNINVCDIVVALVSKKDCGTSWEIGMAYALGKKVILLGYDETTFLSYTNLMLAFSGECIDINNLSRFLLDMKYKTINIKNEWEGIE